MSFLGFLLKLIFLLIHGFSTEKLVFCVAKRTKDFRAAFAASSTEFLPQQTVSGSHPLFSQPKVPNNRGFRSSSSKLTCSSQVRKLKRKHGDEVRSMEIV